VNPVLEQLRAMHGLYGPPAATMARECTELGAGLAAQLETLSQRPSPDACERMAQCLEGAKRHVLRLGEALQREAQRKAETTNPQRAG
jgi:hypothetical protein